MDKKLEFLKQLIYKFETAYFSAKECNWNEDVELSVEELDLIVACLNNKLKDYEVEK